MKILVLGDSFSFGSELSDLPVVEFGPHGNDYWDPVSMQNKFVEASQLSWPSVLAKIMDCEVTNLSLPGGSNDRIFRLAVKHTVWRSFDVIICAWTAPDRIDITSNGKDLAIGLHQNWHRTFPWIKEFMHLHWDAARSDINSVTKILALQSFFSQQQQKYLYVKSFDFRFASAARSMAQHLDLTHCVDWQSSLVEWAAGYDFGPHGHFLEQGHCAVAQRMAQELQVRFKATSTS